MSVIDLLIRIKNGYMARRELVESPYSKFRVSVLEKLKKLGYIQDFSVSGEYRKTISITLKYKDGDPAIVDVKIFSTPGRRIYHSYKNVKPVKGGMGYAILSSSKGIITGSEAHKDHLGGELLFHIW